MKQLKFLMVALTLMMGLSLTSCIGEGDPTVRDVSFGRVISTYPFVIETPYGVKFTATNTIDQDVYTGDHVYFQYSFNSEEQNAQTAKNIDAAIVIVEKIKYQHVLAATDKGEEHENATILQMGNGENSSFKFLYYDKNNVLLPVMFLAKKTIEDHYFVLVFDESEIKSEDKSLKLYLRHRSSEEKPTLTASSYRLFNIESALATFSSLTGKKPTEITIYTNETRDNTTDALDKKKDKLTEYSLEYNFKE